MGNNVESNGIGAHAPHDKHKRIAPLKAPQSIIHIKHRITLRQYKYWVLLLQELRAAFDSGIQPDEKGFFAMPMAKLAGLMGYTPVKSEIWDDLLALKNETLAFNILNKDGENEKYGAGFISEWRVSNSYIRFKFPSFLEDVMRWLDDPKAMFSLINWEIFNHFTGKYEAIIYKLCKDYIGIARTPNMTLAQFREYMGIKPEEYPEFKKLNVRVISAPVKRINDSEVSDIAVFPKFTRDGRKVTGLHFRIEHKKQTSLPLSPVEEDSVFRFAKFPVSPALQEKYLAMRPQSEIALCIERANEYGEQQETQGKAVHYGKLYATAIKIGWHEQHAAAKTSAALKQARRDAAQKQALEQKKSDAKKSRHDKEEETSAWALFGTLPDDAKQAIETAYLEQASKPEIAFFRKRGRDAPAFRIFVRQRPRTDVE